MLTTTHVLWGDGEKSEYSLTDEQMNIINEIATVFEMQNVTNGLI